MTAELAALECLKIVLLFFLFVFFWGVLCCFFSLTFFSVAIGKILFKLACNKDKHNILNEFKFQLDWSTDCEVP